MSFTMEFGASTNPFDRWARPSSRAAFLFSWNGPVFRSEFEKTLDKTEAVDALARAWD